MTGPTSFHVPPLAGQPAKAGIVSPRQQMVAGIPSADFAAVFDGEKGITQMPETGEAVVSEDPENSAQPDDSAQSGHKGSKTVQDASDQDTQSKGQPAISDKIGPEGAQANKLHTAGPIVSDAAESGRISHTHIALDEVHQTRPHEFDPGSGASPPRLFSPYRPGMSQWWQPGPTTSAVSVETIDGDTSDKVSMISGNADTPPLTSNRSSWSGSAPERAPVAEDLAPTPTRTLETGAFEARIQTEVLPKEPAPRPSSIEEPRRPRGAAITESQAQNFEPGTSLSGQTTGGHPVLEGRNSSVSSATNADGVRTTTTADLNRAMPTKTDTGSHSPPVRQAKALVVSTGQTEPRDVVDAVTSREIDTPRLRHAPRVTAADKPAVAMTAPARGFTEETAAQPRSAAPNPDPSSGQPSSAGETARIDKSQQAPREQASSAPRYLAGPASVHMASSSDSSALPRSTPSVRPDLAATPASPDRYQTPHLPGMTSDGIPEHAAVKSASSEYQPRAMVEEPGRGPAIPAEATASRLRSVSHLSLPQAEATTPPDAMSRRWTEPVTQAASGAASATPGTQSRTWNTARPFPASNLVKEGFVAELGIRPEAGIELPPDMPFGSTGHGSMSMTPSAPGNQADSARHIGGQLATAVASQTGADSVEIALDPEELGRVQMNLKTRGDTLTLTIFAERPETVELMRRNIDQLSSEFRQMGYADVSFSFGGTHSGAHGDPHQRSGGRGEISETAETDRPDTAKDRPRIAASGLDMRL
ncbi:flagellar hook-length control protein FliK [Ruegeria pomeroyi]|uniref:Flagellar hook-length control protein FliK n=1 Tax=Ruegeria pomeroyi TaxID=89184 RepID=A0A9Q3ZN01_9RHOB|nr:flagellar hook-length control protein FliK [Ruegeria pomeroyi]MCE8538590.1 flagellar hook-length control protein FliK [Ruegeria pomeroyi]